MGMRRHCYVGCGSSTPTRLRVALLACTGAWLARTELAGLPSSPVPADAGVARRYSPGMARCMAALSKLAFCSPDREVAEQALQHTCGTPCDWAGLELEAGSKILVKADGGSEDRGYVAKFRRKEEANVDSLPERGCILVLRGAVSAPERGQEAGGIASGGALTYLGGLLADPGLQHRLEVWESDAVCKGCQVSTGVNAEWKRLRPRVMDHLLDSECKPGDAIFVTGHSEGAAMATLAMFSLQAQEGYHVQPSYNFESPRVGNEAFAVAFNQVFNLPVALFRITHGGDRVPREPSRQLGYVHAGFQVWYRGDRGNNDFVVCGNSTEDPLCGNEGLHKNSTCPLKANACPNSTCSPACKEWAPSGGPHCRHPLAPASSFCDFAGNSSETWGSEWNEVVKRGDEASVWEQTCVWGRARPTPAPLAADHTVVAAVSQGLTTSVTPQHIGAITEGTGEANKIADEDGIKACLEMGVTYQPLDMVGHYFTIESDAWACQARCAGIKGCAHFSFFQTGADGDCHVADEKAYKQGGSIGFVSGPPDCIAARDEQFVQFLGGGFPRAGLPTGPYWFFPGLAAAGALTMYFLCLAALAFTTMRRTEVRMSPQLLVDESSTAPMLAANSAGQLHELGDTENPDQPLIAV